MISLVCVAGACLLSFFVLLAGGINAFPVNLVYFLEADTSKIPGANRPLTAWTVYGTCGVTDADRTDACSAPSPAYPFDPASNFGSADGVPMDFVGYVLPLLCARARVLVNLGPCAGVDEAHGR